MLKRLEVRSGFPGGVFIGNVREGAAEYVISSCTICRRVGVKVKL